MRLTVREAGFSHGATGRYVVSSISHRAHRLGVNKSGAYLGFRAKPKKKQYLHNTTAQDLT